ncbi:MAG: hypothetical protein KA166_02465 [Saprospiraceae bacterium]|nr:hypothetical protein [Saprospiraceae bacterium]MBP8087090.1 hypothetical protein [Saprospiraceae bacterium]
MKNSFLRMALGSAVLWAIIWIGIKSAENNGFTTTILWASIGRGLFMGISWALIMKWMSGDPYKHVKLKLESEETVVKEGGANLIPVNKGEGGKLAVTNRRLLFKGQRYDTRDFQFVIEFDKIESIRTHKSWKLLKNELHIAMTDGTTFRFAVDHPVQWLSAIEGQMSSARNMRFENA